MHLFSFKPISLLKLFSIVLVLIPLTVIAQPDWRHFKTRFYRNDGRIIDTGNHQISHTEGQGFAMLFAVAADDHQAFATIWKWTKTHLENPRTHLFYWRYDPNLTSPISDHNNASDGDTLIAWALLKAGQQWNQPEYTRASEQITNALLQYVVINHGEKLILLPGVYGFNTKSEVILNPSYFIFPAWRAFALHFHKKKWWQLLENGQELIDTMRFGKIQLPTDWVKLSDDGSLSPAHRWPARMSYDAIRIPLYLYWDQPDSAQLKPWASWFSRYSRNNFPAWINVLTGETAGYAMNGGLLAVRDLITKQITPTDVQVNPTDDYYSAALKLLTSLAQEQF